MASSVCLDYDHVEYLYRFLPYRPHYGEQRQVVVEDVLRGGCRYRFRHDVRRVRMQEAVVCFGSVHGGYQCRFHRGFCLG